MLDGLLLDEVYKRLLADLYAEKSRLAESLEDLTAVGRADDCKQTAGLIRDWPNTPLHAQCELLSRLIGKIVYTALWTSSSVEIHAT